MKGTSGRRGIGHALLAVVLAVITSACGEDTTGGGIDSGIDAGPDAGPGDAGDPTIDVVDDPPIDAVAEPDAGDVVDDGSDAGDTPPDVLDEEPDFEVPPGPPEILLTIDELPPEMNGTIPYMDEPAGPFEFTLLLPTWGFTLDLLADRPPEYLDPETFEVICDQPFGPEGELPAETNLGDQFEWGDSRVRWLVPEALRLAETTITCEARVANLEGELSDWSSVTFDTQVQTPELHPFSSTDIWVITFSRDRYDIELEIEELGNYAVTSTVVEDGDGEADFLEDLRLVGLRGEDTGTGAADLEVGGVRGASAIVTEWIISDTMRQVRLHYGLDPETGRVVDEDSVNMTVFREGDEGAPDPVVFDGSFSIHGVGGDAPADDSLQFGRATAVDFNNRSAQDDSILGYGSFTTNMVRQVVIQPAGRLLLREFLPGTGTPIGESDFDAVILADGFDPRAASSGERFRYNQLTFLLGFLTKGLAALVAHEMGHSLGLVPDGPPPIGLFSDIYDSRWMNSDPGPYHIDTPGLNLMQTGGSLLENPQEIQGEVSFNPLNMAYLRGRLIVLRP